jgi:mannitol-1-phosphate 5-dehydrogenase
MSGRVFVGFGFGPIQSGLFVAEAFASGNFSRLVVAEIDAGLVEAVRSNGGAYCVNVAGFSGIEVRRVEGVEIYNPNVEGDREKLLDALAEASEIATSLPAVRFYDAGAHSVAELIGEGITRSAAAAKIIYAAENNNRAAEILEEAVSGRVGVIEGVEFLNTVIGKMSQVVAGADEIEALGLAPIVPGFDRAFLVEEFNRILVSRVGLEGFERGIEVFIEKDDLLPFEEAKMYGHNAIHALLAYVGAAKGYAKMTELKDDQGVMEVARSAFVDESGAALVKKYAYVCDDLFTDEGYCDYAEDLLERITNPYLSDAIARAGRDVRRKLGYHDRIFGTMDLAFSEGIEPVNMAVGALAGIGALLAEESSGDGDHPFASQKAATLKDEEIERVIRSVWGEDVGEYGAEIIGCVCGARERLAELL